MPSFRASITGRVQGVGFRYFVQRKATEYGLRGYARNMPNGGVEIAAEGNKKMLLKLGADLKKGPSLARVDNIQIIWSESEQDFKDFSIRH